MLHLIQPQWVEATWAFCHQQPYDTLEIQYYLINLNLGRTLSSKRNGNLYISTNGKEVDAVAFFNAKGVMYISFSSEAIFKKVDFLKAIHKEQPVLIRGRRDRVERVFYFLQRVLKDFQFYPTKLMRYTASTMGKDELSEVVKRAPAIYSEELDIEKSLSIVPAHKVDWLVQGKFLMEVEQHFRTQTLTLNNLRAKIHNRVDFEFYHVLLQYDKVIGQLICEFATDHQAVLGGIYIKPQMRGKSFGKMLTFEGVNRIVDSGKEPVLYVSRDNKVAIKMYEAMGFEHFVDMMDLSIKLC